MATEEDGTKDWSIARTAISLLLNNKLEEAEALFTGHPDSFHVKVSRCFVSFMNAIMTYEDDKLEQALSMLKEMERECAGDIGWLKSVKNKMFRTQETGKDYVNKLERQIVLADLQVCAAILSFVEHELSRYMRGGWMLRKAWRVYQHAYTQISQLYRRTFGTSPTVLSPRGTPTRNEPSSQNPQSPQSPQSPESSEWSISSDNDYVTPVSSPSGLRSSLSMFLSLTGITSQQQTPFVEPAEVTRLMSAVSFGYGIYQLCVSLLPPSMLKVVQVLGFEGDRQIGLAALMYARLSEDMHAPLATLSLLWYHTIVRPHFAIDGSNVTAGVTIAKQLITESYTEFHNSAFFLFFAGRIERLESNLSAAIDTYGKAVEASSQQELKQLCLHEMAWCHLICLNYDETWKCLQQMKGLSKWSKSFYMYIGMICCGANGKHDFVLKIYNKIRHWFRDKNATRMKETQLGAFIMRRVPKLVNKETGNPQKDQYYRLLVYELLYLWNAMPSCSNKSLRFILKDCKTANRSEEPMVGLADLLQGVVYSYLGHLDAAITCYRNCVERRSCPSKDEDDQHISAFALYELGSTLYYNNNSEEGKTFILKAQNQYKDYDFDARLNVRIHFILKDEELKNVVEIRDELKSNLREVANVIPKLSEAILNLRNEVSEEMNLHTENLLRTLSLETVRNELQTYDADKTGRTDYALESSGGAILSTRDTEPYSIGASVLNLFGIPLCQQQNTPRALIQTGVLPGECWALKGSSGSVVIRLLGHVHISGVSLEHISSSISPTGETATAPRDFSIWGLLDLEDEKPFLFGRFVYDNTGSPLQYFDVENRANEAYEIIELKVHSNSGNPEYTCIYRLRVHGTLERIRK
ncbi:tetratricopeptide repeat protein 39C-like [Pseudomyrmex gracilis]|uniref:tetratricopeptide repeat protein 39C-like n=1 Tax=Pseudomyrmex gracilis TaxID=219809 RepID=UPI0009953D4B|nr:tetratricopeptide repeat protein 39C-like [Pseudomyrmex gracilis]